METKTVESTIIDRGRSPEIAGTRITVYDVMDYVKHDWHRDRIATLCRLSSRDIQAAIDYIDQHREQVATDYQGIGSREQTLLRRFGHRGSHRVQVDIRRASEQRCFIEQQLALVATLPEMARATILPIGAPSDMFGRAPHPPTDVR